MAIILYGEIGKEIKAKNLVNIPENATIRLNSYGGDVFEAQAIYNIVKDKKITCQIDGICASAATLIACGCSKILMPSNGIFMIHEPMTALVGYYNTSDLKKLLKSMVAVENTILAVYNKRIKKSVEEISELLSNETWYNAQEALEAGFVDEVTDAVEDVKNRIEQIFLKEGETVTEQTMYEKFKAWLKNEDAKNAENERITALENVKTNSIAQRAILNLAKQDGRTLEQIQPELDAIAIAESQKKAENQDELIKMLKDYLESGANEVGGSPKVEENPVDEVVKYAKEMKK